MGRIWRITGGEAKRAPPVASELRDLELDDDLAAKPLAALVRAASSADARVR